MHYNRQTKCQLFIQRTNHYFICEPPVKHPFCTFLFPDHREQITHEQITSDQITDL